jgi:hypothetical protein
VSIFVLISISVLLSTHESFCRGLIVSILALISIPILLGTHKSFGQEPIFVLIHISVLLGTHESFRKELVMPIFVVISISVFLGTHESFREEEDYQACVQNRSSRLWWQSCSHFCQKRWPGKLLHRHLLHFLPQAVCWGYLFCFHASFKLLGIRFHFRVCKNFWYS